jgi:ComF family protein
MIATGALTVRLNSAARIALNAVLPPRCLGCGVGVEHTGALCASCWEGIDFLAPPLCRSCGFPFELDPGEAPLCGACRRRPPVFDRARAVFAYNDGSRDLLLGFKHADRTEGAPAFAAWMARAGAELVGEADAIVPVPLHRWGLFRRRYNQAALLARPLGRVTGLPVRPDLLVRRRRTASQGAFSPAGRRRNVAGAFAVRRGAEEHISGKRLLLVDDVLTTGATVEACARGLRRAGAAGVDILTLARVVRPRPD